MKTNKNSYYDSFTVLGKFFYDVTLKWARFLAKHRILYYILTYTWGILTSLFGLLLSLILLIAGKHPEGYYWIYFFRVGGDYWGGFSAGSTFLRDKKSDDAAMNQHEFGHTFQNTLLGPLAIFMCYIPSIIRYWTRTYAMKKNKPLKDYDAIWFEASATDAGAEATKIIAIKELAKAVRKDSTWK